MSVSEFGSSVASAYRIVAHVWTQIDAMEDSVDREIARIFKEAGAQAPDYDASDGEYDESEGVLRALTWYYGIRARKLTVSKGMGARRGSLQLIFCIAPPDDKSEDFEPYVALICDDASELYVADDLPPLRFDIPTKFDELGEGYAADYTLVPNTKPWFEAGYALEFNWVSDMSPDDVPAQLAYVPLHRLNGVDFKKCFIPGLTKMVQAWIGAMRAV